MCADFAARGRSSLNCRELHWTAPGKLAAVQSSPWLLQVPTAPPKNGERQRDREQHYRGRKRRTPKRRERLGKRHENQIKQIQRARTVDDRGQRSDNWFITSARILQAPSKTTTPTQSQRNQEEKQSSQKNKEAGGATGAERKHKHTDKPTRRREEREAGRQHKTEGEWTHENQRGCSSALADAQWGTWIITDEYLSEEMQSTPTTHTQWCRGYTTPHRATAFDAMGCTKSRNKAPQHAKQNARQPSRTQGNDTWKEAPVTTWARQPRGVVHRGGG